MHLGHEDLVDIAVAAAEKAKPSYYEPDFVPHSWVIDAMEEAVRRAVEEYESDSALLTALQNAGVENWDGYDFALEILESEGL